MAKISQITRREGSCKPIIKRLTQMMKKNLLSTTVALACLSLTGCNQEDDDLLNIAPVFDSGTAFNVPEGNNTDTGYTAIASGDTVTYQISGSDAGQFSFDTSSGTLTFNETPDYENPTTITVIMSITL